MSTNTTKAPLTPERRGGAIVGMGACYALGTFTDNFYKQAAILLAAAAQATWVQSLATVIFSLPFIVFSAWAGALADRKPKKSIIIGLKSLELAALLFGGWMLAVQNWGGMLVVMFLMGVVSTFFSPAINGSIPELFPAALVPRANSLIKLAATAAILAGIALAGVFLDFRPVSFLPDFGLAGQDFGCVSVAAFALFMAALGLATAFALNKRPAAAQNPGPFPWSGPVESFRHALQTRKDKELFLVLLADAWFYGIAAIAVISIANMITGLGYSNTIAGLMSAVLMIGVAAGSLIAGRFSAESWRGFLLPAGCGMAFMLLLASATPLVPTGQGVNPQLCFAALCFLLCGIFGGMYLIPLESFIQVRPAAEDKGKIIAVSNFLSFVAMAVFGAAFQLVSLLPPALTFVVYGISTLLFLRFTAQYLMPHITSPSLKEAVVSPLGIFMRLLLSLRYKVTVSGLESIAGPAQDAAQKPGFLIMPNHPALIDPVIVYSQLAGLKPRPLSDEGQMQGLLQSNVAKLLRVVTIPDMTVAGRKGAEGVRQGLQKVVDALKNGDNVLLYPAGRIYRSAEESLGGNTAAAHILAEVPETRVLLVRTGGLWGSSFSRASGRHPLFLPTLIKGLRCLAGNLFFFAPRREVNIRVEEPVDLPRGNDKRALNSYLEHFYHQATTPPVFVPRYFWRKEEAQFAQSPAPAQEPEALAADVPDDIARKVHGIIRQQAGMADDAPLDASSRLGADLYLDSLAVMEIAAELESEFGHQVSSPEELHTVGHCLLAAAGTLQRGECVEQSPAPEGWSAAFADDDDALCLAEGAENCVDAFLRNAAAAPARPLTADRSGVRTRKQLLIGMLAFSAKLRELPGTRLGIMLPSVPAALVVWLAALHAGKTPVFINWTVGRRNLEHCIALAGITHAVTAKALLDQLDRAGNDLSGLGVSWVAAESLAKELTLLDKVRAAALALLHCSPLPFTLTAKDTPETAAVLFTSGSEARPKGVPLSHTNVMTNASDVLTVLKVQRKDKLLAMLPPFHSFGLLVGLVLPATSGVRTAYHANPTESERLTAMVRDYGLTVFGATPTFLEAMLAKARQGNALASLRYAFAGAEKCPKHVYEAFAACCPHAALCEGYGITECSPVVSVNRPDSIVEGSIGHVLPSVTAALVVEEPGEGDGYRARRAGKEETGMLLVRGPSIFSGYLAAAGESPANPFVHFEGHNWYRTGDLLVTDESGRLFFKGRLKRFVKIGGEMISLPQMEDVLQQAFAHHENLPDDGKPYIAVEAVPGSEDAGQAELYAYTTLPLDMGEVNAALRSSGLSALYSVKRVVHLEAIPVLGTGKVDYRSLTA